MLIRATASALLLAALAWWCYPRVQPALAREAEGDSFAATVQAAPGRVAAIAPSELEPVQKVLANAGDRVKKGQVLVQLDDEDEQAELRAKQAKVDELRAITRQKQIQPGTHRNEVDAAQAKLRKAETETEGARKKLERIQPLAQQGVVAKRKGEEAADDLEKAKQEEKAARDEWERLRMKPLGLEIEEELARLRTAEAELEEARRKVENCKLRAPIDGIIHWLQARPGMIVRPGTATWGEIVDLNEVEVRCDLPAPAARKLTVGQAAQIHDDRGALPGTVTSVGIALDAKAGTLPAFLRVKNPDQRLLLNATVQVRFEQHR